MLHAVILICAMSGPCDRSTAIDVMSTPVRSALPTTCFMQGQAFLAQTELGRDLRDGEYVRIACEREKA